MGRKTRHALSSFYLSEDRRGVGRARVGSRSGIPGAMPNDSPPYWALIAALFSSIPLNDSLAMALYHAGCELHRATRKQERSSAISLGARFGVFKNMWPSAHFADPRSKRGST